MSVQVVSMGRLMSKGRPGKIRITQSTQGYGRPLDAQKTSLGRPCLFKWCLWDVSCLKDVSGKSVLRSGHRDMDVFEI